nr:MAG TPA: hypothetical protein [Caudoviricetes sp.]
MRRAKFHIIKQSQDLHGSCFFTKQPKKLHSR